jgi:Concanavalin A-like lectin/glucanases superfamily
VSKWSLRVLMLGLSLMLGAVGIAAMPSTATAAVDPVIAAAGDIACAPGVAKTKAKCHQAETSDLLVAGGYDAVLPLGDEQYECGQLSAFQSVYDPSWGRVNGVARPVVGDNEYAGGGCSTPGASGYFTYFGDRASPDQPGCKTSCKGYYSYDLGAWHIVALNSECTQPGVGGCSASSPMLTWLKNDLAANPTSCTLAYMHRPYWGNGSVVTKFKPLVQTLYNAGVEVLLVGHSHNYSRFAPQDPNSVADPKGVRQFTLGTGGVSHTALSSTVLPNTEKRDASTFGVLSLTLKPTSYDFNFVPDTTSGSFTDSGSGQCQGGSTPGPEAPTATTGAASGVGQSGATVNGTVNPNGSPTTYSFDYGTTTAYGSTTAATSAGSGTTDVTATAALTGLAPSTTYHYRVVATNDVGTTAGSDATFTTTAGSQAPVALWRMDEPAGATVMVDSAGDHDGAISSDVVTGVPGNQGLAYEFTGPSPVVRVPHDAALNPGTQPLTASTWLQVPSDLVAGDYNVIQKGTATATGGAYKLEVFAKAGNTKFGFPACAFNGKNAAGTRVTDRVYGPKKLTDGQWHEVVCRLTATQAYVEVDGIAGAKKSRTVTSISNSSDVTLGGKPNNTHFFNGRADEVSITIG